MEWLVYLGVGAVAGLLAGLLGVGGGVVIVPALVFAFTGLGYPSQHIMHLALGTSLASIMFTSVSSFRAHHRRGAVLWNVVKTITPGILFGTYAGTYLASMLSSDFLQGFFIVFLYWVSLQMLLNIKPKPKRTLPGWPGMFGAGTTVGGLSALVGIGGGSLSVPFMTWCNVPMHTAVGTSSAIGLPIAVAGAVGYLVNGLSAQGLPAMTLGYISIPALVGVAAMSVLTAPLGARLAHALPVGRLKKIFALLLIITATRMLVSLL